MKLSDLKPITSELLRVVIAGRVLCDIRLERRLTNDDTPERWRIVDTHCLEELSLDGKWVRCQKPKDLKFYRFESPQHALDVWNRGVALPSLMAPLERTIRFLQEQGGDSYEAYRGAYETINLACGGATAKEDEEDIAAVNAVISKRDPSRQRRSLKDLRATLPRKNKD
jgi:hypothetical protein